MDLDTQRRLRADQLHASALEESRENARCQLVRLQRAGVPIPPWLASVAKALGVEYGDTQGAGTPHDQSRATTGATTAGLARFPVPGVEIVGKGR